MKSNGKIWANAPVLIGLALTIAVVIGGLLLAQRQERESERSRMAMDYQFALIEVLSALKDAETGQRGYLLTGEDRYLDPYRSGVSRVDDALARIDRTELAAKDVIAGRLRTLSREKLAELSETLDLATAGERDAALALIRSDRGIKAMREIRAIVASERAENAADLAARGEALTRQRWLTTVALTTGLIVLLVTTIWWMRLTRTQLAEMDDARRSAEASLGALQGEVEAREAAEGQLRHIQKMETIGQLTGGIAHDFNNMLAIVIGNLDLASRRFESAPDRALAAIGHAREGAERAAALTARLLAFSRRQPLAPEAIDANRLVTGMSEMLRRTLGDDIRVETVLAGGLWRTHADAGQLENAIVNLAVNGRDAMPDGGCLTIETSNTHLDESYAASRMDVTPGQYVSICVTDTGTGMAADVIERAFDPFFTTKPVGKGTGLGLSQVFGFIKQSGGHVAIYSEPGEGTTVKLYLPRFAGSEAVAIDRAVSNAVPTGRLEEVILVVEDEQRVRHLSVDALRELGYTVLSAPTPSEALKIAREQPVISLLFTDVVMPEMDGRKLADAIAEIRPGIPVIFTTGYTRNSVVHNGRLDAGVNFLAKPYSIAQLAQKLRGVLDQK